MEYYGTLGPACLEEDILRQMLREGMTGLRINLSHGGLKEHGSWIHLAHRAAKEEGKTLQILIDLEGPELRIGTLADPVMLQEGTTVSLRELQVPESVLAELQPGETLLLDDGKMQLQVAEKGSEGTPVATVLRGGLLQSRKSLAVEGRTWDLPTLTEHDRENLSLAGDLGVTGVMLPFARGAEDVLQLKSELQRDGLTQIRIFAKIENLRGLEHVREIAEAADEIVIARGDLGNAIPLWELPGAQKRISSICRETETPFMVVTQMLDSMCSRAVPTRAEVLDVYQAVLDGASSVMLTGETASGAYPAEAMRYLVRTGREAERDRETWKR